MDEPVVGGGDCQTPRKGRGKRRWGGIFIGDLRSPPSFFLLLGNSESWKVETAITLPVVCTFPAREMPLQRCKAIAPGVRARARAQLLGQSARPARAAGGSEPPDSSNDMGPD